MQKHILRELLDSDIPAVSELERLCNPMPWNAKDLIRFASHSGDSHDSGSLHIGRVAVLVETEQIIGYVCSNLVGSEAEILVLGVAPEHRRQGVGESLIMDLRAILEALGCYVLFLEVRESNAPAIALYCNVGFEEIGLRKGYYADTGEGAKMMRWAMP